MASFAAPVMGVLQHSLGLKPHKEKKAVALNAAQEVQPLGGAACRRKLRHVSQFAVRGLELGAAVVKGGYVLELAVSKDPRLRQKSDVFRTDNPTWEPPNGFVGRNSAGFEISAVPLDDLDAVLWKEQVQLSQLEPLGCESLEALASVPLQVLLVQLGKSWYSSRSDGGAVAVASTEPLQTGPRRRKGQVKRIKVSEICGAGDHISVMIARLHDLQSRSMRLVAAIEEVFQRDASAFDLRQRREQMERRVDALRLSVAARRRCVEVLRSRAEEAQQRIAAAERANELNQYMHYAEKRQEDSAAALARSNKELHSLSLSLRCRQMRMLHEMSEVYPIECCRRRCSWTIRGLAIASIESLNRQDLREEENVSTALGYLAHVFVTLTDLLSVPLCITFVHAGSSRSAVRDLLSVSAGERQSAAAATGALGAGGLGGPGSASAAVSASCPPGREWPLYYGRGLERPRFEMGLRRLRDGLRQFLYSRGRLEASPSGSSLLEALHFILQEEVYGPKPA